MVRASVAVVWRNGLGEHSDSESAKVWAVSTVSTKVVVAIGVNMSGGAGLKPSPHYEIKPIYIHRLTNKYR
jgi:hypothetical protein